MGIIKRQGSKTLLVNYLGAAIGAAAVLFVYSSNDAIYGYAHWLFSTATLLMPLASFGVLSLIIKYYPDFNRENDRNFNGFLSLIAILLIAAFLVFLLIWNLLTPAFYGLLKTEEMNYAIFQSYEKYILILVFLFVLLRFLSNQSANRLRIVIPNLIQQFGYKLYLPILVLLFAYYEWTIHQFSLGMVLFFAVASVIMVIYVYSLRGLRFSAVKRPRADFRYRDMASFSLFGILNQLGNSVAMRIDSVMIPIIMGSTEFNSFYVKAFFMANFIEMPTRSLNQIASPIISKAWKENDLVEIKTVYKKASANLLVVGLFVFLGIWYCLDDLVNISSDPDSFPFVREIFLLIGFAKLIDMMTSVNSHIIGYSDFYKYNLLFIVSLAVLNLILNIKLIDAHGIVGAAIASAISIFLFNLMKLIFIKLRFGMLPFSLSNVKSLVLAGALFAMYFVIDFNFHPILNIFLKAGLITAIYLPIAYYWNISSDINKSIDDILNKIKTRTWI